MIYCVTFARKCDLSRSSMRSSSTVSRGIDHMTCHGAEIRTAIGRGVQDSWVTRWAQTSACVYIDVWKKVSGLPDKWIFTKTVTMVDTESHPRPRRTRHDSAKHYDAQRKDLELTQVLDVLQCYVDYGGGINCCVCGKLSVFSFSTSVFWFQ